METKPIPEAYHSITPYLSIKNAGAAIDFYKRAFGAQERFKMQTPDGKVGHAELQIGDSVIMLADEYPDMDFVGPQTRGGSCVLLHLYVDDVDVSFKQAIDAGAIETRPVKNQFYGDRSGNLTDPFGHIWCIATHVEDIPSEELEKRASEEKAPTSPS